MASKEDKYTFTVGKEDKYKFTANKRRQVHIHGQ